MLVNCKNMVCIWHRLWNHPPHFDWKSTWWRAWYTPADRKHIFAKCLWYQLAWNFFSIICSICMLNLACSLNTISYKHKMCTNIVMCSMTMTIHMRWFHVHILIWIEANDNGKQRLDYIVLSASGVGGIESIFIYGENLLSKNSQQKTSTKFVCQKYFDGNA